MTKGKKEDKKATKPRKFWNWTKFFVMKWRFRIDQARSVFGLLTFAALLAVSYIEYLSFFERQGFWGIIEFTLIIFAGFLIGGYLYDRVFRLWAETQKVTAHRNPYTYVPNPRERIITLGYWTYILQSLDQIAEKLDLDIKSKDLMRPLIEYYISLTPNISDFEDKGLKMKTVTSEIIRNYLASTEHEDLETIIEILTDELKKKKEEKIETS